MVLSLMGSLYFVGADFVFPFPQTAGCSLLPTRQDCLKNRTTAGILWWLEEPESFESPTQLSHLEALPLYSTPSTPVLGFR